MDTPSNTPPAPVVAAPAPVASPATKRTHHIWWILLGMLIGLILGAAAGYLAGMQQAQNNLAEMQQQALQAQEAANANTQPANTTTTDTSASTSVQLNPFQ